MQLVKNIGKLIGFVVLTAFVAYFGALLALWTYEHVTTPLVQRVDAESVTVTAKVEGLEVVRNYGEQKPAVYELHQGVGVATLQGSFNKVN